MMKHGFEVLGLNANFEVVSLLRYLNLQWTRRYFNVGSFSIQIPLEQYDKSIKYIYTKDRPEVGKISQINYISEGNVTMFCLSGFFLEDELNKMVVHRLASDTNILNSPAWSYLDGNAEDVAYQYFEAFKRLEYEDVVTHQTVVSELDIGSASAESQHRGKYTYRTRNGEYLGNKLWSMLKVSDMSFRVEYDFVNNTKVFRVIKGKDLTQDNEEMNNPIIFSTKYGNLINPNIVLADTDYKNGFIVEAKYNVDSGGEPIETKVTRAKLNKEEGDLSERYIYVESNTNKDDYSTDAEYNDALLSEGQTALNEHKMVASFDFDVLEGSYDYMTDFDLGDKCTVVVNEIGVEATGILTECAEVIKDGSWTLTMDFDVEDWQ